MSTFTTTSRIIVTCNKRLGPYLAAEVEELGYKVVRSFTSGVELAGTLEDCIVLNLKLRCASQVLFSLKSFFAVNADDLYKKLVKFPWNKFIASDGYFSITSNVHHPSILKDSFANLRVKDAIVDQMRASGGERPNSGAELKGLVFHLYWNEAGAELFIDTSGETLAKHGYRKFPGDAPMLEALAAAIIRASNWNRKTPFINPMCGSGTIAIEAALLATNRYPGLLRSNYSFMHIKGYQAAFYQKQLHALQAAITPLSSPLIEAGDISEEAVRIAKINAAAAGVAEAIHFEQCDFAATKVVADGAGVIYFNPEYGERLGDATALIETYRGIGDFMKKNGGGYTGYVFTGNLELAKQIGLKPRYRMEFYTSTMDSRLLVFELYSGTKRAPK